VVAAYGMALAMKKSSENSEALFNEAYNTLASTRPTAVNLFWALDEMQKVFKDNKHLNNNELYEALKLKALEIHQDDIKKCEGMGKNGFEIFRDKSNVLTHCNTGQLATGGGGTAFNVIKYAFDRGKVNHVFADETRPLLQGSRLTSFELEKAGIPFSIIVDSAASVVMQQGKVDLVITGADRIAANGDAANKIGTYSVAIACKYHNIPFYVAAPTSTIDRNCPSGNNIKIEERHKNEIIEIMGKQITRHDYNVYAPAFDVTPNELISGIITEEQFHKPPYNF
jgi:methylthioribose-1-phosphate isomerase